MKLLMHYYIFLLLLLKLKVFIDAVKEVAKVFFNLSYSPNNF